MAYATAMRDMDRAILKAIIACQDDDRVTVEEYRELADMRQRGLKLKHRQWQRDTFPSNYPPERITA